MRRLKTFLRSTMGTERLLGGLGLLREISSEQVVDVFLPEKKNRRLSFLFQV